MIKVANAFNIFIDLLIWAIIFRSLSGILFRGERNKISEFLYRITEPIMEPTRNLMDRLNLNTGPVDFSPLIAVIILGIIRRIVIGLLV